MKDSLWFRRKRYGWGWVPATWQGWAVIAAYIILDFTFALTIDEESSTREVFFTFLIPLALLTATLFRILYKKGEKPRWQWGEDKGEEA